MRQNGLVRQNDLWEQPLDGGIISDAGHQRETSPARGQRRHLLLLQELPAYLAETSAETAASWRRGVTNSCAATAAVGAMRFATV